MRLKTLNAPTMAQAMELLRRELGLDAIIVSTETTAHGVRIVAALEEAEPVLTPPPVEGDLGADIDPIDAVHEALLGHGLPNPLLDRLVDASFLAGADDPLAALTGALAAVFSFRSLGGLGPIQPIILVGPPGAGKTVTAAKLATRAVLAGRKARLITTDTIRAGAVDQLDAFARVLKLPLATADTPQRLARLVAAAQPDEQVLIDTAGINPYLARDMGELSGLLKAVSAEPVLVLPAGGDAVEAMEQASAFAPLGISRLLATRLDMVRRLGGLLAAAHAAQVALADYGDSPSVADGLLPLDPGSLARLLMPDRSHAFSGHSVSRGFMA
jgi:flagellar biosynthesis protein FlhF